jgi:hypothetical protein
VACTLILLTACKKNPSQTIIGKWQAPTMQVVEFHEGGTLALTDSGMSVPGRYTFQKDGMIMLDFGSSSNLVSYSFKDTDTLMMGSGKKDGSIDEFRRIKQN